MDESRPIILMVFCKFFGKTCDYQDNLFKEEIWLIGIYTIEHQVCPIISIWITSYCFL